MDFHGFPTCAGAENVPFFTKNRKFGCFGSVRARDRHQTPPERSQATYHQYQWHFKSESAFSVLRLRFFEIFQASLAVPPPSTSSQIVSKFSKNHFLGLTGDLPRLWRFWIITRHYLSTFELPRTGQTTRSRNYHRFFAKNDQNPENPSITTSYPSFRPSDLRKISKILKNLKKKFFKNVCIMHKWCSRTVSGLRNSWKCSKTILHVLLE